MKKISTKRLKQKNRAPLVIFCLFAAAVLLMSVGFASYNQTLDMSGQVTVLAPGRENKISILDVVYLDGTAVVGSSGSSAPTPSFTETTISFNTAFHRSVIIISQQHSARFAITIRNNSYVDYTINADWNPYITNSNGRYVSDNVDYSFEGFENGDILRAGDDLTMTLTVEYRSIIFSGTTLVLSDDMKFTFT